MDLLAILQDVLGYLHLGVTDMYIESGHDGTSRSYFPTDAPQYLTKERPSLAPV